jgi:rhamnogalacturonan endolyase
MKNFPSLVGSLALTLVALQPAAPVNAAPYQMEKLGRGVVAVRTSATGVYVGWRLLGLDASTTAFNVYRGTTKLNASPITASTNYVDNTANLTVANTYTVRPVVGGVEQAASAGFTLAANAPTEQFLRVPLQRPASGTTPPMVAEGAPAGTVAAPEAYDYVANDCSAADLDGDGEYEIIVKWDPTNAHDNSHRGYTGNVYIDAYKLNGTRMWRIDLGINIRAGAHYTQFQVYDYDGDGKAEVVCKTSDGTRSGTGQVIGSATADHRSANNDGYEYGYIMRGPEFLTVFSGVNGSILASTSFVPTRHPTAQNPTSAELNAIWGDGYGNRCDRYLAGTAYLDGTRPSIIMARGYYTRTAVTAWDYRNGQLTRRWTFDTLNGAPSNYTGQGAHSLSIADVDNDGKHEIIYGACTIDDNGVGKYSTGIGHGDALHVSDMNPSRAGLEVFMPHEEIAKYGINGSEVHDANTGTVLVSTSGENADVGRGCAGDIDSRYPGYEIWASRGGLKTITGTPLSTAVPTMNFMVYWDADLKREILSGNTVSKWDEVAFTQSVILTATGCEANNGSKATPALSADILGDWREEVILRESGTTGAAALRIYTTTIPANNRFYTLMHDAQYRVAVAWQNTGYNQPPHPSFYLGTGMAAQPVANITYVTPATADVYQAETATLAGSGMVTETLNSGYNGTAYLNFPATGGTATLNNIDGNGGGTKAMAIRYANGAATARAGTLTVNGTTTTITFQPTGAWNSWATMTVNITLNNNATNSIRFASNGGDLGNIDQITIP